MGMDVVSPVRPICKPTPNLPRALRHEFSRPHMFGGLRRITIFFRPRGLPGLTCSERALR
jgi:hypothetical protein